MITGTASNWVPSACTLPTVEQPLRAHEFDTLFAENLVDIEELAPTKARLTLSGPGNLVELVQDLADRESSCCSFFAFEVSAAQGDPSQAGRGEAVVNLDVEVPIAYTNVLAALMSQARAKSSTPAQDRAAGCGCCATPA